MTFIPWRVRRTVVLSARSFMSVRQTAGRPPLMRFRKGGALFAAALAMLLAHRVGGQAPGGPLTPSVLPFTTSFLVTGDFASASLDLQTPTGKLKMSGVPKDADILAAFIYVEAIHLKSQIPKDVVASATFRNMPLTAARTKALSRDLTGSTASCYASNTPLTMTELRFDVLHMLPRQLDKFGKPTGKLLVNDADLSQHDKLVFSFPDRGGNLVPQFAGATLVVVFRHPDYPLRKIVVNDGIRILGPGEEPEQKIGGFYESDPLNRKATLLIMGGAGAKNTTDALVFNGSVVKQDPFPASSSSSDRSWSGATIDVSSQMPGTNFQDFGETVSFKITHGKTSPYECIALAGSWFSVTVADRDGFRGEAQDIVAGDGIPDRLERPGGPLREPNGMLLPDVYAWGARDNQMDAFIEVNALKTTEERTDGSANAPYDVTGNSIVETMTVPPHDHMPPPDVIVKFVDALKNAPVKNQNGTFGIRARVDVGKRSDYHGRGTEYAPTLGLSDDDYLFADALARGGETDLETKCNATDRACHFPDYGGVMGWGYSTQRYLLGMDRDKTGGSPRLDKNRNGNGLINYAVFGHWAGKPRSLPCLDQYGSPTLYDSPTSQTCAGGQNPGFDPRLYRVPTSSSGSAALPGFIHQVTMGGWEKFVGTPLNRATTWLHEWAHNGGIWHGGPPARLVYSPTGVEKITAANCNPFYHSVSNYDYQANGVLNLNNVAQVVLSDTKESSLQESTLKDLNVALRFRSAWFVPLGNGTLADSLGLEPAKKLCVGGTVTNTVRVARFDGPASAFIDWATNGFVLNQSAASQDINYDGKTDTVMDGYNDWANIRLDQRGSGHIMGGGVSNGGSDFGGSDFGGSDFGGSDFGGSDFGGSDFGGSDFGGSDFGGSDFGGLDRDGSDFGGSDFGGSDFGGTGFAGDAELTHEKAVALGSTAPTELSACVIAGDSTGPNTNYPRTVNGNLVGSPACEPGASGQTHKTRVTFKAPSIVPQPTAAQPITEYRILRAAGANLPIQVAAVTPTQAFCPNTGDLCTYFLNEEFPDGLPVTIYVKALFSDSTTGSAANTAIIARNDAPVAIADAFSTLEDTPLSRNVLLGDSDVDSALTGTDGRGSVLVVGNVTINPGTATPTVNGVVTLNLDGSFTYSPNLNFYGTDFFSYKLLSGTFAGPPSQKMSPDSSVVTETITVTPVNDAPSFTKGLDETVAEDSGPGGTHTVAGWATQISAGPPNEITCPPGFSSPVCNQVVDFVVSNNNNGLFSVQPAVAPTGTLTYTLAPDAYGSAIVTLRIHDNGGTANGGIDTSAAQTFTVTVNPVNDAPSFTKGSNETVAEDSGPGGAHTVAGWATQISAGPPNEITCPPGFSSPVCNQVVDFIVSNDNNGLFSVQPAVSPTGTLTYTLAQDANGSAMVTLRIHDTGGTANGGIDTSATQTFTINVTEVNDPPVAQPDVATTPEDTSIDINVIANDSPGPPNEASQTLTVDAITMPPTHGVALILGGVDAGKVRYTPVANYNGPDAFNYRICDNGTTGADHHADPLCSTATVNITVTPVNDDPVAGDDTALTGTNTPVIVNVLANDTDVDGDTLTVQNTLANVTHGSAARNPDNTVTFKPDTDYTGTAEFDYTIEDGHGGTDTAHVTVTVGHVSSGPDMASARRLHTSTLLADGNVLVAGGRGPCVLPCNAVTQGTAELYNPSTNTFSPTGNLAAARQEHIAIRLNDGNVLLAGGFSDAVGSGPIASAEIYTVSSGMFSSIASMTETREEAAAVKLADGRVLVTGGYGTGMGNADLFDPVAGTFTTTAAMAVARSLHTATLLLDGRVLIVGGFNGSSVATAELFDPIAGTFTPTTGSLIDARHGHTAALLPDGKVLIAGGVKCVPDCSTGTTLSSAEVYDPSMGTFSAAGTMTTPRQEFTATILADGKVLLSGGRSSGVQTATLEVYDPTGGGTFTAVVGTMSTGRASHAATLLPNGKVLITGGDGPSSAFLKSTSLFQP